MRTAAAIAATALLAAAWWWRRQDSADLVDLQPAGETGNPGRVDGFPEPDAYADDNDMSGFDLVDTAAPVLAPVLSLAHRVMGTSASGMTTSSTGLAAIQRHESLKLTRYRLGDGGWTIGWGRYYPDGGALPPERIDRATADAWFAQDVAERGERWVRAYVTADLSQPQFDALVSMAYNLRPASFRTIAEAVNAGADPEAAALRFVRAGTNLERGLRNRRAAELAMFRTDPTTYG